MSWASGSGLFSEIIEVLMEKVDDDSQREELYTSLIELFENHDCDTLDECQGVDSVFDSVWKELYPTDEDTLED